MRTAISFLLICASFHLTAQVYTETFSEQEGLGIRGACDSIPLSCDSVAIPSPSGWTIAGDASGMLNADDYFLVVGGELQARDIDGEVCFVSPWIDLSGCDTSQLIARIDETGDLEASDYVDVSILADTALIMLVDALGSGDSTHTITGDYPDDQDWQSIEIELLGIVADSGRVRICVSNNSGTETIRLDDIEVSCQPSSIAPDVYISEVDCDQPGTDTAEFIELAGPPGQPLDDLVLVLYNGSDDASYAAYDFAGEELNQIGLFTICYGDNNAEYCDLIATGQLQNGADGIGLYHGWDIDDFPENTPVTDEGLIDGLRYATGEPQDTGLALLDMDGDCPVNCQIDEEPAEYSIQRGSWFVAAPTPGALNMDPLAVEWISFNAKFKDGFTYLKWATATEHHNAYFSIEYARDRSVFTEIGRVPGHHSSNSIQTYRYTHQPVHQGQYHYYRVRAVDENGNSDYTGVRVVEFDPDADIDVWPTIARSTFHVRWPAGDQGEVRMYTLSGELVLQSPTGGHGNLDLDVSGLSAGMYVVQVSIGQKNIARRIVVQPQ